MNAPAEHFAASLDHAARTGTALYWGLAALAGAALAAAGSYWLAAVMPAAGAALWCRAPLGYRLDHDGLTVRKRAGDLRIQRGDVLSAERFDPSALKETQVRLLASARIHGYFGQVWAKSTGRLNYQATRRDTLLLLRLRGAAPLVVSPDDPQAFAAALGHPID